MNKVQLIYNYQFIEIVVVFLSFSACVFISCKDKDQQAMSKKINQAMIEN